MHIILQTWISTGSIIIAALVLEHPSKYVYVKDSKSNNWKWSKKMEIDMKFKFARVIDKQKQPTDTPPKILVFDVVSSKSLLDL